MCKLTKNLSFITLLFIVITIISYYLGIMFLDMSNLFSKNGKNFLFLKQRYFQYPRMNICSFFYFCYHHCFNWKKLRWSIQNLFEAFCQLIEQKNKNIIIRFSFFLFFFQTLHTNFSLPSLHSSQYFPNHLLSSPDTFLLCIPTEKSSPHKISMKCGITSYNTRHNHSY